MNLDILLSGEGPSDLGSIDSNGEFKEGPMTCLIKKIIDSFSIKNETEIYFTFKYISRNQISNRTKELPKKKLTLSRTSEKKFIFFRKAAIALGLIAKEVSTQIAVYFHDADRTNSEHPKTWEYMIESIETGFLESDFKNGLAMVPKPTSEAWLICCLKKYRNCEQLENLPGNESSDRHPKKILNEIICTEANTEILLEIACEKCDVEKIKMPSFIYFKEKLEKVLSDEVS